ncbi:hypothetical protein WG909_15195 (plasmid) [Peptostreptococcaceae bacterium AGR-M142]
MSKKILISLNVDPKEKELLDYLSKDTDINMNRTQILLHGLYSIATSQLEFDVDDDYLFAYSADFLLNELKRMELKKQEYLKNFIIMGIKHNKIDLDELDGDFFKSIIRELNESNLNED